MVNYDIVINNGIFVDTEDGEVIYKNIGIIHHKIAKIAHENIIGKAQIN